MANRFIKKAAKKILHQIFSGKDGFARVKVKKGIAKGVTLCLDVREEGSYWLGTYDQWIFDAVPFEKIIRPGMVVWDCGTYIGYYTAVFRTLTGNTGKVIGFEAAGNTWQRVNLLPSLNNWQNVEIKHLAVGPDHTTIKFATNLGGSNGPLDLDKKYKEAPGEIEHEVVTCCGVDELVYEKEIPAPDFIKFDLESGEEYALHNGQRLYTEKRPVILLELHGQKTKDAAGLFLEKYNYAGYLMNDVKTAASPILSKEAFDKTDHVPHMIYCVPR